MSVASISECDLRIRRIQTRYVVSTTHQSPQQLRQDLDEAVRRYLPSTLTSTSPAVWAARGLWFIHSLDLQFSIDTSWDSHSIARAWAAQICGAVSEALARNAGRIIRFDDESAYLAQFLSDAASDEAWSKWYYEAFLGLRVLPTPAALRTAICDTPEVGERALLHLTGTRLLKVVGALTESEARRVVEGLAPPRDSADGSRSLSAAAAALRRLSSLNLTVVSQWSQTLLIYLETRRIDPSVAGPILVAASRAVAVLKEVVEKASTRKRRQLLVALRHRDHRELKSYLFDDAEVLRPLILAPEAIIDDVIAAVSASGPAPRDTITKETLRWFTPFGGTFLLLSNLLEVPLSDACRGWPGIRSVDAAALVRWLVLVKSCGSQRADAASRDAVLRKLLNIDECLTSADVKRWLKRVSRRDLDSFLEALLGWHRRQGVLGIHYILTRAGPRAILLDARSGLWIVVEPSPSAAFFSITSHLLGTIGGLAASLHVVGDESLCDEARRRLPQLRVLRAVEDADSALSHEMTQRLSRPRVMGDLSFLSLPSSLKGSTSVDAALSVTACAVLRAWARRLPGFAHSDLQHLSRNFLETAAEVEEETSRYIVHVSPPPLNMVLQMIGMTRSSFVLPWLQKTVAIFPQQ